MSSILSNFNLDQALQSIQTAFSSVQMLVTAVAYIIGVSLIARGIMMYRAIANATYGSASRGELAGPMVHIMIGGILCFIPSTVGTSLSTIFGPDAQIAPVTSMIGYNSTSSSEQWQQISAIIVNYMQLLGLVAFVRGWVILSKMGHSGAQPGSMGKGLTHIIGGVLLMNIVQTVNILAQTFGYVG